MKNEADRVKRWRERQKSEGKVSITVLLSHESRAILAEEKEKTGESYAVIVEKALQTFKKQGYRLQPLKSFSKREEIFAKSSTREPQKPVMSATERESKGQQKILIDDLANYPSLENIEREQAAKNQSGLYDLKFKEGLVSRLFRSSGSPIGRKKKWFK